MTMKLLLWSYRKEVTTIRNFFKRWRNRIALIVFAWVAYFLSFPYFSRAVETNWAVDQFENSPIASVRAEQMQKYKKTFVLLPIGFTAFIIKTKKEKKK